MDRRTFLRGLLALAGAGAAAGALGGCASQGALRRPRQRSRAGARALEEVDGLPVASWLVEENARPGTLSWVITTSAPGKVIEGFADAVSIARGGELGVYVNTTAASYRAEVYRMGFYQGRGGRLVHVTPERRGEAQPPPAIDPVTHMVECHWRRSFALGIDDAFLPGNYLIKLVGSDGSRRYVPFTVRDDTSRAAIVVQNSVTTWQAYNLWGGYSLYGSAAGGPSSYAERARVVSFDRPYGHPPLDPYGSGDWLGNEFPFLYLVERHGLDVAYATDIDLHRDPGSLERHRCFVSLGHDEYWSSAMRTGALTARDRGVNLMFLGANACYRHIRLAPSPLGPDRREICYKDASEDPLSKTDPSESTQNWALPPDPRPESELIGSMYQSYQNPPVRTPLVVVDASSFVYAGTGLADGDEVPGVVGSEFDAFEPGLPGPRDVEILAHSPTPDATGAPSHSDATYYTERGGGGVFATGTASWVQLLWDGSPPLQRALRFGVAPAMAVLTRITLNVLRVFAAGPASRLEPSRPNWRRFYPASAPVTLGSE
ncbi:MAG TPA: N,N-dimethylformamidase beta subunit family domain-containing protein [Acidimicrobiales bacterium]|nr:N,N-dimethylformamidase beta subunit family domain-containing protein [Acidimicrobiales bacterium]